jgi:hypothetical protein
MDVSLIEELITKNKSFKIETAAGRVFDVPHRTFVSFSTRKTSLIVSYEENGTEHLAIVPLFLRWRRPKILYKESSARRVPPSADRNTASRVSLFPFETARRRARLGHCGELYLLSQKPISWIETRSAPAFTHCYPRSFTFHLGNPFPRFLIS